MRRQNLLFIALLGLFFTCALLSCNDGDLKTHDEADPGDDDDDDDQPQPPDDLPQWLTDRPYLQNRSLWRQDIDMADPPLDRELGCIGVGNGRVFGIIGDRLPLATWHNLGGPNYQKEYKWFTDKTPQLLVNGHAQQPSKQSISRVRNSDVVIIESENRQIEWTSVNFAPRYAANELVERALVSVWIVRNLSDEPVSEIRLEIFSNLGYISNGCMHENTIEERFLDACPLEVAGLPGATQNVLSIPVGRLEPGQERAITLNYCFSNKDDEQATTQILEAIGAAGVDAILEASVNWWDDWADQILVVDSPDEKFNDLMRGLAVSIKINQAVSGGVSEMDQYSNTWLRDVHGPSLFYPMIGLNNDYADMLNYLWAATLHRGGISNAFELDYDTVNLPPQPDWEVQGVMGGRLKAEGPSLLILEYENHYKATGDHSLLAERYSMLKHALLKQMYVDGCLLHFSSDETFEDVMEIAFGENFIPEPDETTLSFYSSVLALRASYFMIEVAELLGETDDAELFTKHADNVKTCLQETFWMQDLGRYAVKADTATREPFPQPYEDVSTMPLWLDALEPDNYYVTANFESLLNELGQADGTLWSPLPFPFTLLAPDVRKGFQSGMSHGYWLSNLDKMFHPLADEAFRRWADVFTATGFTDEAVVVDDYGHLKLLYEPFGIVGDVSSRFRSWESGVLGFSLLYHLTGYDASLRDKVVKLAPHLPPEWGFVAYNGLAFGEGRLDLEVGVTEQGDRRLLLTTDGLSSFQLELTMPLAGQVTRVLLNGEELSPLEYRAEVNRYDRTILTFDPLEIAADSQTEVVVSTVW